MTIDCVIIGGGIIGMMTARKLSKEGLKVQILEKGELGQESSWAGGGILSPLYPWDAPEEIWPLITNSQKEYPGLCVDLLDETGVDPELIRSGLLNLEQIDNEKLDRWAEKTGSSYSKLDSVQIAEIEPALDGKFESAIWLPEISQIRNPRLLKALKKSLVQSNVQISEGVEVTSINQIKGKVESVETSKDKINCKFVVVAAGAWTGKFLKDKSAIKPVRGQMLRMEVPVGFLERILLKNDIYLIPRQVGQLLIGSSLEYVGFDKSVTKEMADKLYTAAIKILPSLSNFSVSQQWAGLRPGTDQGIPVIEESKEVEGLFINSGHFRNGVALAPASSDIIADLIRRKDSS